MKDSRCCKSSLVQQYLCLIHPQELTRYFARAVWEVTNKKQKMLDPRLKMNNSFIADLVSPVLGKIEYNGVRVIYLSKDTK